MLLAGLGISDFVILAGIVAFFVGGVAVMRPSDRSRLRRLESKLDLLLKHFQIADASLDVVDGLSAEVRQLADAGQKIEAIKVHREQTGLGLKDAKDAVEAYLDRR